MGWDSIRGTTAGRWSRSGDAARVPAQKIGSLDGLTADDDLLTVLRAHELASRHLGEGLVSDPLAIEANWLIEELLPPVAQQIERNWSVLTDKERMLLIHLLTKLLTELGGHTEMAILREPAQ